MAETDPAPTIEEVVERHAAMLYRFAYRLTGSAADAEDLVQETFLVAHQKLHHLRDPERVGYWLLRILRNCWSGQLSHRLPTESIAVEEIAEEPADWPDGPDELDRERLLSLLGTMPEEYREALLLFYFRGLRYREIADVLDCPIGTVMSRIARGKAYLRSRLAPHQAPHSP